MSEVLVLGFLLGMRHALEADHVAAVVTLAAQSRSTRHAVWQGVAWGLGHTATLFAICSVALFADAVVPERLAQGLEAAVGAMLVLLGADLWRRLLRERVHFHAHRHGDGTVHLHAHSHAHDVEPHSVRHEHRHPRKFPARALYVGLMHGLAGSAALIVIALGAIASPLTGLLYVGLFGLGSVGGMALLTLVVSVPLRSARKLTWLHNGVQATLGLGTVLIGAALVYENALAAFS